MSAPCCEHRASKHRGMFGEPHAGPCRLCDCKGPIYKGECPRCGAEVYGSMCVRCAISKRTGSLGPLAEVL